MNERHHCKGCGRVRGGGRVDPSRADSIMVANIPRHGSARGDIADHAAGLRPCGGTNRLSNLSKIYSIFLFCLDHLCTVCGY